MTRCGWCVIKPKLSFSPRPNIYPSFSIPSFWITRKSLNFLFVFFLSPFFPLVTLSWVITLVIVCLAKDWTAKIRKMKMCFSFWLPSVHLPIMTLRPVVWVPRRIRFTFIIFVRSLFSQYQTQMLLMSCTSVSDVARCSYKKDDN